MAAITTPRRVGTPAQEAEGGRAVLRWTGAFGLGAAVLLMVTAPLYAAMGSAPSLSNGDAFAAYLARNQVPAITTKLIDAFYALSLIVFAAGLRHLIRRADDRAEWAASLTFGFALVTSSIILVGDVLGAAAAMDTYRAPDASAVRALTEASLAAFGAFTVIATAAFLLAASGSILATRALPLWMGWAGLAAAALNLAAAPTIYGGSDFMWATISGSGTAGPYAYATVIAGIAFTLWQASTGIGMIWRSRDASFATSGARR